MHIRPGVRALLRPGRPCLTRAYAQHAGFSPNSDDVVITVRVPLITLQVLTYLSSRDAPRLLERRREGSAIQHQTLFSMRLSRAAWS